MEKGLSPVIAISIGLMGAAVSFIGVLVGKLTERKHEYERWLRDNRLAAAVTVLRSLAAVRDYARQMTQLSTERTLDEKQKDKWHFGERRRSILNELEVFELIGSGPQRECANRLSAYMRTDLNDWMEDACRDAERGAAADQNAPTLAKLEGITREFIQVTEDSLEKPRRAKR